MAYIMEAKENYDATRVSYIAGLSTYANSFLVADQNHQGIQWDPVRRNLMYMYVEHTPASPTTNNTGHTLWDGATATINGAAFDTKRGWNTSVAVKNIDTEAVTFHLNYNASNLVPAGIGGSDGTWRRNTHDFHAVDIGDGGNGPGMTDPYTGNFWVNSQSCELYCFRAEDDYSQVISPIFPVHASGNDVQAVGFTSSGATGPWVYARETDSSGNAYFYLTPRLFTSDEITADYLLIYASFTYPVTETQALYTLYNREVLDHAGNLYLFSCKSSGGKDFKLFKFTPPTSAPYGGPTVGGGFSEITPWGVSTGPNGDGAAYTNARVDGSFTAPASPDVIPMYLPGTDDLVLISKFFPQEKTVGSYDPANMFWSCTYVHAPASGPTFDHHSAFATGYMTQAWAPTDAAGAYYAVSDAFEVNSYLGQSDYDYSADVTGLDYTKRWFFFVCNKVTAGVADDSPRLVLVEYRFVYGSAPSVVQVIDEQGWDDAYPSYGPFTTSEYAPYDGQSTNAIAASMTTSFNPAAAGAPWWDTGVHDPQTNTFWWSGGAVDPDTNVSLFGQFDSSFSDRMQDGSGNPGGTLVAATPPLLKLSFDSTPPPVSDSLHIRCWGFSLDGHDFYVLRLGVSATFVYDLTTGKWSEWESPDRTDWRPHCGQNWIGFTGSGSSFGNAGDTDVFCGDDTEAIVWRLNTSAGRDDRDDGSGLNDAFTRIVTGGLQVTGRDTVPCGAVELDLALGNPTQTGASITLEMSDDSGHTWINCGAVTVPAGNYLMPVEWSGLGSINAPGRVFRLTDDGLSERIGGMSLR